VKFAYTATLDFKKFYQQFELHTKPFWAFIHADRVYLLSTIATGGVFPPLFAQALSRSLLALAVRTVAAEHVVEHDCCIDNLRLASDNIHALRAAWFELLDLCAKLGATIGEMNPPAASPYTYLGMLFSEIDGATHVELALKSKKKLTASAHMLAQRVPMLVVDLLAIFGQTVWGCTVTGYQLGRLYYVLKFVRRLHNRPLDDYVSVWPSIVDTWSSALLEMTTLRYTAQRALPTASAQMFVDASESGWGAVIFNYNNRAMRIFAGPWSEKEKRESINMLELRALRIGIRMLSTIKTEGEIVRVAGYIDNTTARAWALRRRAPKWQANQLALEIDDELKSNNITISSLDYVQSARNFADAPSRRFEDKKRCASQLRPTGTAMKGGGGNAEATKPTSLVQQAVMT
jgi:hypothetical protein